MGTVPVYPSPWRRSDPGLADAFRDADFLQTRRMDGLASGEPGWEFDYSLRCEIRIAHRKQRASYSPLTQALSLFPDRQIVTDGSYLEFHTLSHQEDQGLQRVVCVRHDRPWTQARVAVFSSHTMEWQIFHWVETGTLTPKDATYLKPGKVVDGFVYWTFPNGDGMLVLNTVTSQFHRMDVPQPLKEALMFNPTFFELGQKLCIVHKGIHNKECKLFVWSWGKDGDGVERWKLDKSFPLRMIIEFIKCSKLNHAQVTIVAVIDGFVYLSVDCHEYAEFQNCSNSPEWLLSLCLETAELHQLFEGPYRSRSCVRPYVMSWPPCLDGSEAVGKGEPTSILITALQSSKEALITDDEANITETKAFFSIGVKNRSLVNKIATLDARLTNARDHVLRISADSAECKRPCLGDDCFFCVLSQVYS
ncbi:hypothetical protein ACQJBY_019867 [Aegilops geniculata]